MTAWTISGDWARLTAPSTAIVANHTTITGPNSRPTAPVPKRWMANRPIKIATEIGTTAESSPGLTNSMPSTAESTLIAGVIIPSPNSSAVPNNPSRSNNPLRTRRPVADVSRGATSAVSARMPPSPWLSARRSNSTYLMPMINTSVHTMIDTAPITFTRSTARRWDSPSNASRIEYSGLVPRSP